jgi:transposase
MDVLYPCCAGLDVHKKNVVAGRLRSRPDGQKQLEIATFETTTPGLLRLLDWLREWGCTHAAMESTGEYWKPVYAVLEGHLELLVVNARHIKGVPGRKTDVKDAAWIADLLRHGLLKASFVPPRGQRDLRDLTRQRTNLVEERARVVNRIQKGLEGANLKLASVATDITGVSGRAILTALAAGKVDPETLAELARGRLRDKREALVAALTGCVREHHRFLLALHLEHLEFLEEQIEQMGERIAAHLDTLSAPPSPPSGTGAAAGPAQEPPAAPAAPAQPAGAATERAPLSYREAVRYLDPIPGIDTVAAERILAELGTDMRQFPSAAHAASWTGLSPGNYQSAGKRYGGRTRPGNRALRQALVQAAHGAIRTKNSYFGALYQRLAARRGKKRAIVAVAHALLGVIYHVLLRQEAYEDLGAEYFEQRHRPSVANRLVRHLEALGYQVTLEALPAAA